MKALRKGMVSRMLAQTTVLMVGAPGIFGGFGGSEVTGRGSHGGWRGFWEFSEPREFSERVVTLGLVALGSLG
jgi:hypothetical protein